MTETGKVTKIDGVFVTLRCKPGPVCHGCGAESCLAGREVTARNPRNIPLAPGDYVEISAPPAAALRSALRVFGLPVLGFALFYAGAGCVFGGTEKIWALAGFAGLILSAAALAFFGGRDRAFPEVLSAVQAAAEEPAARN
ncbi:MAG: SoxR reducing system RseC family protein [Spirochaetales bacterium]|jgi:positive regulator of sigma E activity|nr:SoxR reducing system RseC family protein [Spirochaetales bacterium]